MVCPLEEGDHPAARGDDQIACEAGGEPPSLRRPLGASGERYGGERGAGAERGSPERKKIIFFLPGGGAAPSGAPHRGVSLDGAGRGVSEGGSRARAGGDGTPAGRVGSGGSGGRGVPPARARSPGARRAGGGRARSPPGVPA